MCLKYPTKNPKTIMYQLLLSKEDNKNICNVIISKLYHKVGQSTNLFSFDHILMSKPDR